MPHNNDYKYQYIIIDMINSFILQFLFKKFDMQLLISFFIDWHLLLSNFVLCFIRLGKIKAAIQIFIANKNRTYLISHTGVITNFGLGRILKKTIQ